ncbi:MAG: tetratricopeptide (TPR) repeat protein [Halioglobus sp.]|jgi:tetratricopeptide (TPR) repeat protein
MTQANPQAKGDLDAALLEAVKLLKQDPAKAAVAAQDILTQFPENTSASQILGAANRLMGQPELALDILEPVAARVSNNAKLLHELGLCYSALGQDAKSLKSLRDAVQTDPKLSAAWLSLGNQLALKGDNQGSTKAFQQHLATSTQHPQLVTAAEHLQAGKLGLAEPLVRKVLKEHPTDVSAMRLLADIGIQVSRYEDAKNLLERALELAPDFTLARNNYAVVLFRRQELTEALEQVDLLLKEDPNNPRYLILKGSVLVRMGTHLPALSIFEKILESYPRQAAAQLSYGHTLKTVGRVEESISAYRKAIEISPTIGEAYWSLANLKTFRFADEDIAAMRAAITLEGGDADDQSHIAFALGKALEDRREYNESFKYYKRGNAIRRIEHIFDPKKNMFNSVRQIHTCTAGFFEQRAGQGCQAPDPIFIVGLPRAGSTLLEQILASHSSVEGTAELPDIIAISRELGGRKKDNPATLYPEILAELSPQKLQKLGEDYLESTRIQRSDTPFFIDKMPNNFLHIGLIHLILPRAKIIDARRHPMAGCFAGYKQLFAKGQTFTYDLTDVGHYYRNYVKVMDHWDEVLPGRVLRVQYEDMVADSDTQIRRVLEHCELPFEEQCLRFYETDRAIRTPSAEQVRQPIFQEGLEQWRHYETHLNPLKKALGPLLKRYPIE